MANHEITFAAGTVIFEEGAVEDTMYFLKSGKVEIVQHLGAKKKIIEVLEGGTFFGEMALVNRQPRVASAIAVTDCLAIRLDHDKFLDLVRTQGEIAFKIIVGLCERMRGMTDRYRQLFQKNKRAMVLDAFSKLCKLEGCAIARAHAVTAVAEQLTLEPEEVEHALDRLVRDGLLAAEGADLRLPAGQAAEAIRKLMQG